ncbi:MAG: N-acetylneuraminate synthase family protein [Planctomycetota bacterium]
MSNAYRRPRVVAEIGCNHRGSMTVAKELVKLARDCGVEYVKFQKRTVRELLTPEQYDAPHPNPHHAYGTTYGAHREFLEFDAGQHRELKEYCRDLGVEYSCSVWDVTAARQIIELGPNLIKIPSARNHSLELLRTVRDEFDGIVQVSLGMTTRDEERAVLEVFEETGAAAQRLTLYACTSGYPVAFEDVCLLEIERLRNAYRNRVRAIGFSGHHLGIAVDIAAYTLGAEWIERHFTADRTWKGTDHAASLEATGLRKLVRDLQATHAALTHKREELLPIEAEQRAKLKTHDTAQPRVVTS